MLLKEKLNAFEYGLMVLSAAGAVLIAIAKKTVAGPQPTVKGDLLVFLSMFAAMVMILLSKRLMDEYGALQVTEWMIAIGTLALLIWIEVTQPIRVHFSPHVWLAVIAQGILATTCAPAYLQLAQAYSSISNRWWEHYLVSLSWARALVLSGF